MLGAIDIYFPLGQVVTQELNAVPDRRTLELLIGDPEFFSIGDNTAKDYKGLPRGLFEAYCTRGYVIEDETTDDDIGAYNEAWQKSEFHGDFGSYVGRIMVLYGDAEFMQKVRETVNTWDHENVVVDSSDDDD